MENLLFNKQLNKALEKAQTELSDCYGNNLPVSVVRALLIIASNANIGEPTKYEELVKALNITTAGVSRMVTQLSEWQRLNVEGAGYLHIEKAYNDAGKQVNVLYLTKKGQKLIKTICDVD